MPRFRNSKKSRKAPLSSTTSEPDTESPCSMDSQIPPSPTSPSPVVEPDVTNIDDDMNEVTNAHEILGPVDERRQSGLRPHTATDASPVNSKLPRPTTLTPFASARASYSTGVASPFWSILRRTRSSLTTGRPTSLGCQTSPLALSDLNKPLPSPPIAQLVDPNSPPKARRTLLDAVYDTTTKVQWPALRPENHLSAPAIGTSLTTRELVSTAMPRPRSGDIVTSPDYGDVFVRRQSWRSSTSSSGVGSGPVLRIFSDADPVIMGRKNMIPEVPAVPNVLTMRSPPQRSISSPSNATPSRNFSRPSPIRVESGLDGRQSVLISPIRSMKPTRQTSSPSPLQTNSLKAGELPLVTTPVHKTQHHDDGIIQDAAMTSSTASRGQEDSVEDESTIPTANHNAEATERPIEADSGLKFAAEQKRASAITIDSPWGRGTPKGHQTRHSQSIPALSSARFSQSPSKQIKKRVARSNPALPAPQPARAPATRPKTANTQEPTIKVPKPQKSFRNLLKRGDKRKPEAAAPSRGFMAGTRSSLAKALTSTRNLSRTYLPKRDHNTTTRPNTATSNDPAAITPAQDTESAVSRPFNNNHQRPPTAASTQVVHQSIHEAANVIHNILRPLSTMASNTSDRLNRMEVAEALTSATASYAGSQISAEEAKKHARDAELHAGNAGIALKRLLVLCDDLLDDEPKAKIQQLISETEVKE